MDIVNVSGVVLEKIGIAFAFPICSLLKANIIQTLLIAEFLDDVDQSHPYRMISKWADLSKQLESSRGAISTLENL